jgi:hypothetical protein
MGRVRSRTKTKWSPEEKRIAMEQRLRARTIPARRSDGPALDDWDYDDVDYGYEDVHDLPHR